MEEKSVAGQVSNWSAVIEKFENLNAVLVSPDGQRFQWPIHFLPPTAVIGMQVQLTAHLPEYDRAAEQEVIARQMLRELLRGAV